MKNQGSKSYPNIYIYKYYVYISIIVKSKQNGCGFLKQKNNNISINNRQISFKYDIVQKFETGIELKGTEVKSIREGACNLKDSFAIIKNNEVVVKNIHISPYEKGNINNVDPIRDRKLLLHKYEILKLNNKIIKDGFTLIPTKVYLKKGRAKVEIALGKGKKLYDKRETIKKRDDEINMAKAMKRDY